MYIICLNCKRLNPRDPALLRFYCGICGEPIDNNAQYTLLEELQKEIIDRLAADKTIYLASDRALDTKAFDLIQLVQETKSRSNGFRIPIEIKGDSI